MQKKNNSEKYNTIPHDTNKTELNWAHFSDDLKAPEKKQIKLMFT